MPGRAREWHCAAPEPRTVTPVEPDVKVSPAPAGVAPDRQKIMVKGGLLKDDSEWAKAGIKPGQKLMMMGTADAVPTAPTGKQARPPLEL